MRKEKDIRESLNRLLTEQENSDKVGEVLDRITGMNRSIPDRLWVLRERIKGMREEAEDLSSLLEYHSGSRLSQVVDVLTQAEKLTEETMTLTTGQAPSDEFRISDTGECWEIWDDSVGVGIRFGKWDGESRQNLRYIQTAENVLKGDEDLNGRTFEKLVSFAESRFPREFGSKD